MRIEIDPPHRPATCVKHLDAGIVRITQQNAKLPPVRTRS